MNDIPDAKIKNKKLVLKSDNFQLINNSDSVKEIATLATKVDLKADWNNIMKLQWIHLNFSLVNFFFGNSFQNMFVYHQTFGTLELKKIQGHKS